MSKQNKEQFKSSIEEAREKLLAEKLRIDQERVEIQRRIDYLRDLRHKRERVGGSGLDIRSFKLDDIEGLKSDLAMTPEEITNKILLLSMALKNDYVVDDAYCAAAINYMDAIEEPVNALSQERYECGVKKHEAQLRLRDLIEELNEVMNDKEEKLGELFSPLGVAAYIRSTGLPASALINKVKNSIRTGGKITLN